MSSHRKEQSWVCSWPSGRGEGGGVVLGQRRHLENGGEDFCPLHLTAGMRTEGEKKLGVGRRHPPPLAPCPVAESAQATAL